MKKRYLVIGAGFSGAVVAQQLSLNPNNEILVIDERDHIGGNCYTERDKKTDIMVHQYGPHIFNTDNEEVWNYIQQFGNFKNYTHRVKAKSNNIVYSLPINLHTINQFFKSDFTPDDAKKHLEKISIKIDNPKNFEEQALNFIGEDLYKAFFYGYTKKQWGCEPKELPASILKRLPVRFNYNDSYYHGEFFGIPENGYTSLFKKMLSAPNICVQLNTKFDESYNVDEFEHVFYTGPIDGFFNFKFGRLGYRTVNFKKFYKEGDFQGTSQMNYCDETVPYTRICEHKHFTPWENHNDTVYFEEYSIETEDSDVPFYPKRLSKDMILFEKYQTEVQKLNNYTFLGRLATYRYMDMHNVIGEALEIVRKFI